MDSSASLRMSRYGWAGLVAVLVLTTLVYAPGLRGVYVFDDFPNIVDNVNLHVTSGDWRAWMEAAWSSPSTDLHRPLASLTFALNYFFDGIAPLPMKAVNVGIHLLNGVLLFWMLQRMLRLRTAPTAAATDFSGPSGPSARDQTLCLAVTAVWLLHPINLTAVLYVVQRMESLAQVFVLCGLLFYFGARKRQLDGRSAGWMLWIGVPACMLFGIASKESAALLPLYALLAEVLLLADVGPGKKRNRELLLFFALFLVVPACLGIAWLLPKMLSVSAWATKPFTLAERLLSEPRALMSYVSWTLLPLPGNYSLYRDDFPVSTGLLQPLTTILSIVGLVAMTAASWLLRRRRPLVALGLAWFLAAHVLTASIVPLEIAFEHRNYFASIGLLLAVIDIVLPNGARDQLPIVRRALLGIFLVLCAGTTLLRAVQWGDPVRLAFAEGAGHPASPRATYELGRVLVVLTGYDPASPALPRALEALDKAANVPGARTQPDAALIVLASRTGRTVEDAWWARLTRKLQESVSTISDSDALMFLTECDRQGHCALDRDRMLQAFYAAVSHSPPDPAVLYVYAIFAYNRMHDPELALRLAREAADTSRDPEYRIHLANFLLDQGQAAPALEEINHLRSQNRLGALSSSIRLLEQRVAENGNPPEADH